MLASESACWLLITFTGRASLRNRVLQNQSLHCICAVRSAGVNRGAACWSTPTVDQPVPIVAVLALRQAYTTRLLAIFIQPVDSRVCSVAQEHMLWARAARKRSNGRRRCGDLQLLCERWIRSVWLPAIEPYHQRLVPVYKHLKALNSRTHLTPSQPNLPTIPDAPSITAQ
jgi:hypothetical protein